MFFFKHFQHVAPISAGFIARVGIGRGVYGRIAVLRGCLWRMTTLRSPRLALYPAD